MFLDLSCRAVQFFRSAFFLHFILAVEGLETLLQYACELYTNGNYLKIITVLNNFSLPVN